MTYITYLQLFGFLFVGVRYYLSNQKLIEAKKEIKRQQIRTAELSYKLQRINEDLVSLDQMGEWSEIFESLGTAAEKYRRNPFQKPDPISQALIVLNHNYKLVKK
jgi:hypothetical protein